jgi:hypothetical protein
MARQLLDHARQEACSYAFFAMIIAATFFV